MIRMQRLGKWKKLELQELLDFGNTTLQDKRIDFDGQHWNQNVYVIHR